LNGAVLFILSAWLPWLAGFAVTVVLPIVFRLLIGEDPPDNAITQEQPGDGEERDPGPAALPLAA